MLWLLQTYFADSSLAMIVSRNKYAGISTSTQIHVISNHCKGWRDFKEGLHFNLVK